MSWLSCLDSRGNFPAGRGVYGTSFPRVSVKLNWFHQLIGWSKKESRPLAKPSHSSSLKVCGAPGRLTPTSPGASCSKEGALLIKTVLVEAGGCPPPPLGRKLWALEDLLPSRVTWGCEKDVTTPSWPWTWSQGFPSQLSLYFLSPCTPTSLGLGIHGSSEQNILPILKLTHSTKIHVLSEIKK